MKSSIIDLTKWERGNLFTLFIKDLKCVISLTVDIDVTGLYNWCKSKELKFFPSFMYIVSKVINQREEFRFGYDDNGSLILWDEVYPFYADFHQENESFIKLVSKYSSNFDTFYQTVINDMEMHKNKKGFEVKFNYKNTFDLSCLPWIHYKSCDLHIFDSGTYLAPVVTWGKYIKKDNRLIMPLSIQIHHAVADGYHIARFYSDIEKEMAKLVEE